MASGGGEQWVLCLQQAEEEPSHSLRCFWLGKFLSSLPEDILLSCRQHGNKRVSGGEPSTTKHLHTQTLLDIQRTEEPAEFPREKNDSLSATGSACDSNNVILRPSGGSGEPLWVHVERAEESLRSSNGGSCSSLSPAVHRLLVGSVTDSLPPAPLCVLTPGFTLDWSQVETFLGTGKKTLTQNQIFHPIHYVYINNSYANAYTHTHFA